jgi:hypothetical protein
MNSGQRGAHHGGIPRQSKDLGLAMTNTIRHRHCEERSDEAISHAPLGHHKGMEKGIFTAIVHAPIATGHHEG